MLKKLTALTLALIMLISALSACGTVTDVDVDSIIETIESIFESDNKQPVEDVIIGNTEENLYTIVISKELEEDTQLLIMDKVYQMLIDHGLKFACRVESASEEVLDTANEILVGHTSRKESKELFDTIRAGEYIVDYNADSHRISILGTTSELTYKGFEYLMDSFIDSESTTVTIPGDLYYSVKEKYSLTSVKLDGVDIRRYYIVVPSLTPTEEELYAYYTAVNIADYFETKLGVELKIVDDDKGETEYEILVGETNREESSAAVAMDTAQYILAKKGSKLVLRGYGIYVAAGMGKLVGDNLLGTSKKINIENIPSEDTVRNYEAPAKAKNVILMIGDGMGYNHINAALNTRLDSFAAESFTGVGTSVTRSISVIKGESTYTDSAAGATALSTGYKTINGYVGKDQNGQNLVNIRELADSFGAKTAVITTDVITGATPSGFLTHNISRENTDELQESIDKLIASGKIEYCEGSVDNDLTLHTRTALQTIAYTSSPFFMMVEEGYIDKNSHSNKMEDMLDKIERFNDSIIFAATFTLISADTVLIVTADHETGGLVDDSTSETGYKFTTGNHTNADVPVYVLGAGAEKFDGKKVENVDIPKFMATHFGASSFGSPTAY